MGFVILLHISQVVKPNLFQGCSSDSLRLLTVQSPVCWIVATSAAGSGCLVRALKETCMQWKSLMSLCASLGTGGSQVMMRQWQFWASGAATKGASSSVQPVGGTQQAVVWESTGSCWQFPYSTQHAPNVLLLPPISHQLLPQVETR